MGITTFEELEAELKNDTKVKVAGIDADGVMRGKVMAKDKFMSAAKSGFGFCRYPQPKATTDAYSVIFGWDIHDKVPYSPESCLIAQMYTKELLISNAQNGDLIVIASLILGYTDIEAQIDLSSFRRIPWENN